ncbi:MAG: ABC transporter substrate-binding protein [Alphaproteobacteria bacterium]|nr:ABC transporter substrate-binding protein [Alphaproteobacteria bacterium]MDE1967763.1 ABC transporter substrate-binding protein [Alphaproteobacteria bacterium]MDE2512779.1 ABC transporter substrate-binding protein [Alphaproteobacteria bacterium]
MKRRSLLAVGFAAVLAFGAAAPAARAANDKVVIGVMNDMSSVYSYLGGMGSVAAAKMAVHDFGGKVLGKPIEVIYADHQNKPDVGAAIAQKWFDQDGVDAIVDLPTSSVAIAVQQVAKERGKVTLISNGGSSELTGKYCSPTGVHWTYDTYALAHVTGKAIVQQGGKSWFFITADYAFGHQLRDDTSAVVKAAGGQVLGSVNVPLNNADFSSFLLQAQQSKAQVIGLANAGGDTVNSIKQAAEFGIVKGGQRLAGLLVFIADVNALGLQTAQGLMLTEAYYWDQNAQTRAFAKRFEAAYDGKVPTSGQAGVYGAVMHYLKAMAAAKTEDGVKVVAEMRKLPINDFMTHNGKVRIDGRVIRDMYLFQVKSPQESKYPYDYYKQLAVIPGDQAFRPLSESECPLVTH